MKEEEEIITTIYMERELDSPSRSDSADVGKTCTLFQRLKHLFTIQYLLMAMLLGFSAMQASYCIFIFCKYDGMNKYMYSRHVLLAYRLTFQPRNYCQSWAIKKLLGKIFYFKFVWFLSDKERWTYHLSPLEGYRGKIVPDNRGKRGGFIKAIY